MNITPVFTEIVECFNLAISWMKNNYIQLADFRISFFGLAVVFIVVTVLLSVVLPYFGGDDDD